MAGLSDYLSNLDLASQLEQQRQANQALNDALKKRESFGYSFAQALANMPQQQGYGSWLGNAANAFGSAFNARINNAIDRAQQQQKALSDTSGIDMALKFAQASNTEDQNRFLRSQAIQKQAEANAEKMQKQQQKVQQMASAQDAINALSALAESGDITAMNKSTDNWLLSNKSSENIGKRQAALAALLPLTNEIAKSSGGSGINTLGEMMAYLGMPENATSAQIAGALPGIASKLGLSYKAKESGTTITNPVVKSVVQKNGIDDIFNSIK